jgi:hypothetical protein
MEDKVLVRLAVLSNLLEAALNESGDERFASPQLVEQLREVRSRAVDALGRVVSSGGE